MQGRPQKCWFGENPGKIPGNPGKSPEHLGKISENLENLPENSSKNGIQRALIWKTRCPTFFDLKKWGPKSHEGVFLEVIRKKVFMSLNFFWQIWEKIFCRPKNLPAPTLMLKKCWIYSIKIKCYLWQCNHGRRKCLWRFGIVLLGFSDRL